MLRSPKAHDNSRPGGRPALATDAKFDDAHGRSLEITVYDGDLADEWDLEPPGRTKLTTIQGLPAKVSNFAGSAPAGAVAYAYSQVLVKVAPTRTMLLLSTGLGEEATVAVATSALGG